MSQWQTRNTHSIELDPRSRSRLDATHADAIARYSFYRRRGVEPSAAISCALAWGLNATEQTQRRSDHGTGAERQPWPPTYQNH